VRERVCGRETPISVALSGPGDAGRLISALDRMKEPTVALRGSALGDAIGLGWFLLLTVPERNFAVVALSNAGPDGIPSNRRSFAGPSTPTWG
jgi:hypothetical protein